MPGFPINPNNDEFYFPLPKTTITTYDPNKGSECMSPSGFVSSIGCPANDQYCNCPGYSLKLKPTFNEPTDAELATAYNESKECSLIDSFLGKSWFGVDYSDPHSAYNCVCLQGDSNSGNNSGAFEPILTPGISHVPWIFVPALTSPSEDSDCPAGQDETTGESLGACCYDLDGNGEYECVTATENECSTVWVGDWYECETCDNIDCNAPLSNQLVQAQPSNNSSERAPGEKAYFNYDIRKIKENGEAFAGVCGSSDDLTASVQLCNIVLPNTNGITYSLINPNFKYYKEYSKTSATFWNTPKETPLRRRSQTALMFTQRIKILVHGNLNVYPGTIVGVNNDNFGGRWMVYKIQRIFTPQKHSMYLYLMRDGYN